MFQDDEKKKVTDEQINAFYEERKAALYKVKPADDATATGAKDGEPAAEKPAAEKTEAQADAST